MNRTRSPTCLQLTDEVKARWHTSVLTLQEGNETLVDRIKVFLQSGEGNKQLSIAKDIGATLKQTSNEKEPGAAIALSFLSEIYEACSSRHPIRRAIARLLDDLQDSNHSTTALTTLKESIREKIDFGLRMTENTSAAVSEKMDHIVDYLLSFSENFETGELCIQDTGIEILQFANSVLAMQVDITRKETVLVQQQRAIDACMLTVKLATVVMQRCHDKLKIIYPTDKAIPSVMTDLIQSLTTILRETVFVKDCQSCAGLAVVSAFRITIPSKEFSQQIVDLLRASQDKSNWIEKIPDFSKHCILRGLLAVVPLDVLATTTSTCNSSLLLDIIFTELLEIAGKSTEASSRLALAHTLYLWSSVVKSYVSGLNDHREQADVITLQPGSVVVSGLLGYLWANWDDHMDGIRYQVRLIFDNLLAIESLILSSDNYQLFLSDLLDRISSEDWRVRGKYGPLYCLVPYFGATQILTRMPDIHQQLLKVMGDRNVAPHAKDLIEKLALVHKTELEQSSCADLSTWNTAWIDPIIDVLCSCEICDKTLRLHVVEFCVPVLLRCNPSCLQYALQEMDSKEVHGHYSLPAMIAFLRVARSHGIVINRGDQLADEASLWYGTVPVDRLKYTLRHAEDQVRTDALALICQSHKTTETVSPVDFELLKAFLPLNMNSQSSAFRAMMLSTMKKFFTRLRNSAQTLQKLARKDKDSATGLCEKSLASYKSFLYFVVDLVFDGLHPGASFQRATTSLRLLDNLTEVFQSEVTSWFQLEESLPPHYVHSLILSLENLYDVNRQTALSVLFQLPPHLLPIQRKYYVDSLTFRAVSLICSPRTIDSATGASYIRLLARSCVTQLGQKITLKHPCKDRTVEFSDGCSSQGDPLLCFMWELLRLLQQQADMVQQGLSFLANNPIYGTLLALRLVLADIQLKNLCSGAPWREFVQSLIDVSLSVAVIVGPVVTHSSPEGQLTDCPDDPGVEEFIIPMDRSVLELGLSGDSNQTNGGQETGFSATSQLVLVCSWRCMKEVSLLLGDLVERFPLLSDESKCLLTVNQVKAIGNFFTKQLTECRHRGAFEVAYVGFVKYCSTLWKSCESSLQQLPGHWMNELLSMLQSATASKSLSFTRRSAGLPFFIQTVLSTEPSVSGRTWLQRVMEGLLAIASKPLSDTPDEEASLGLPQVHALNTLRALFRETRLGDHIMPFVSDGVIAAISGISSDCWAVRNSSTLLYSALIARVFGAKRSKHLHAKHNCMTGRQFFAMFPSLHPFLLKELQKATVGDAPTMMKMHPSLFPVLLLLSKLYPSSMEGADTALNLKCFVPFVLRCGSSSVMKTRIMAARALVPLIPVVDSPATVTQLVDKIPSSDSEGCVRGQVKQNDLHGVLLQLDLILHCHVSHDSTVPSHVIRDLFHSLQGLQSRLWVATRVNKCQTTRAMFIDLLHDFVLKDDRAGELRLLARNVIGKSLFDELKQSCCPESQHSASSLCSPYDLVDRIDLQQAILKAVLCDSEMPMDKELLKILLQHKEACLRHMVIVHVADSWSCQKVIDDSEMWIVSLLCKMALDPKCDTDSLQAVYHALSICIHSVGVLLPDMKMNVVELISTVITQAFEAANRYPSSQFYNSEQLLCIGYIFRPELCQAMMSFTSQLISQLPEDQFTATDMINETLQKWILLIQHCSHNERVPDLRIAAAHSLQSVGTHILLIDSGPMVGISLSSWSQLLQLLQDDDVDVRQAAATCVAVVHTYYSQGSVATVQQIQPSWALQLIPQLLCGIYSTNNPIQLFEWLMTIIWEDRQVQFDSTDRPPESTSNDEENSRELFVKGDVNPYTEATTKIDVASEALRLLLQLVAATKNECSHPIFTKCHHLLSQCTKSIVQVIEAEQNKALFQSQWDSSGRFLDLYAVVRAVYALSTVDQADPVTESGKWCLQDLLEWNRLPLGQPKLCKAIQLLYTFL